MARYFKTSDDYGGRQLDLEALQSAQYTDSRAMETVPGVVKSTPKAVAGIQKLAQRYVILFTTITGSDLTDPSDGTDLFNNFYFGNIHSSSEVELMANVANSNVRSRIKLDDEDTERYGPQPDDEKLDDSNITGVAVDYTARTISIHVSIRTVAGGEFTFIIPTPSGIF